MFSTGTFDQVEPSCGQPALPLRLTLTPDRARTTARLVLIVPGLTLLLAPAAIAVRLLLGAEASALAGLEPLACAALLTLPVLWMALVVFAGVSLLPRLRRSRVVTISGDHVSVLETTLLGNRAWRLPIRGYRGIAHHVRATAGVLTHEIILVHANPDRSILLHTAPMVSQSSLDHFRGLLRLPVIASSEVYRVAMPAVLRSTFVRAPWSAARKSLSGVLAINRPAA